MRPSLKNNFIFKGKGAINKPSPDLYNLDGNIQIEMRDDNSSNNHKFVVPISAKQLLLKGAVLKNTKWISREPINERFVGYCSHFS